MADTKQENMRFSCSDIHPNCNWQASGRNEQELRSKIEEHGREKHDMRDLSEDAWNKVRNSIHRTAA